MALRPYRIASSNIAIRFDAVRSKFSNTGTAGANIENVSAKLAASFSFRNLLIAFLAMVQDWWRSLLFEEGSFASQNAR